MPYTIAGKFFDETHRERPKGLPKMIELGDRERARHMTGHHFI